MSSLKYTSERGGGGGEYRGGGGSSRRGDEASPSAFSSAGGRPGARGRTSASESLASGSPLAFPPSSSLLNHAISTSAVSGTADLASSFHPRVNSGGPTALGRAASHGGRGGPPVNESFSSHVVRPSGTGSASGFSLFHGGPLEAKEEKPFAQPEDFENMVGDLRRTFIGWLKKTEGELRRERDAAKTDRQKLEEERQRAWQLFLHEKQLEYEKIREERRKADQEMSNAMKQIALEREDARHKIEEERTKFEEERELHRRKMLLEREKFLQEYGAFESERRRIVEANIAAETIVDLNVGGVVFESSRHVLTQQPGSLLEALLSGRHQVSRDRQGRIFIDRDSTLFRHILHFLRNPSTPPVPRDAGESEAICKEAEYYGIRFFPFPLVFAIGGHNGIEHLRAVEILDVGQQCWRPCRSLETERAYFGSATLHNRLFVYGGQNLDYKALCASEIYDALRDTWMEGSPLNTPRRNNCGVCMGQRLFCVGGFDGQSILASVESYDPRMRNWMEVAPLLTPRSSAMATVVGERLLVIGGTSGDRLRSGELYEPRMNAWERLSADMIEVRSAGCAATVLNSTYAMAGTDNSHGVHNSLEVLDADLLRWHFRKSMPTSRMDAACVVVSESIMVAGGQRGEVFDTTEFYRPELDDWQAGPSMTFARYGHGLLLANL